MLHETCKLHVQLNVAAFAYRGSARALAFSSIFLALATGRISDQQRATHSTRIMEERADDSRPWTMGTAR